MNTPAQAPQFRDSPAGGWTIIAPARRNRSNAFGSVEMITPMNCPFCPGHERETPPEITRRGEGSWRMRVVPNKYPAVQSGHEVIIETPAHAATFDSLPSDHAAEAVALYMERYRAHRAAAQVLIFRNEGERSGASIPHPHSQLIALERLTPRLQAEGSASGCAQCREIDTGERVIGRFGSFVVLAPHASRFAYQLSIVPLHHRPDFTGPETEAAELARLMQQAVRAIRLGAGAAAYNWVFINGTGAFHWYLDLTPRLTVPGGFEVGSGAWINVVSPESAAAEMRPFFME
jgi:UDPglucose--hexose-1-phosphate uridylyltransferase